MLAVKDPSEWILEPCQITEFFEGNEEEINRCNFAWYWHYNIDRLSNSFSELAPQNFGKLAWSFSTSNPHIRISPDQYAIFGNYGYSLARMSKSFFKTGVYYVELVPFIPREFDTQFLKDQMRLYATLLESVFWVDQKKLNLEEIKTRTYKAKSEYHENIDHLISLVNKDMKEIMSGIYSITYKNYERSLEKSKSPDYIPINESSTVAPDYYENTINEMKDIAHKIHNRREKSKEVQYLSPHDFLKHHREHIKKLKIEIESKTGYEPAWRIGLSTMDAYINSYPGSDGNGFSIRSTDLAFVNSGIRTNPTSDSFKENDIISMKIFMKESDMRKPMSSIVYSMKVDKDVKKEVKNDEDEIDIESSNILAYEISIDEDVDEKDSYVEIYKNGEIVKRIIISSEENWFIAAGCFGCSGLYANVGQLEFKYKDLARDAHPAQVLFDDGFKINHLL